MRSASKAPCTSRVTIVTCFPKYPCCFRVVGERCSKVSCRALWKGAAMLGTKDLVCVEARFDH